MTKLLVFSDSHGKTDQMNQVIAQSDWDLLIHCGDYGLDLKQGPNYQVRGNCDPWSQAPAEVLTKVEQVTILVVHGHRHHVKTGLLSLAYYAMQQQADLVLFGHTHQPVIVQEAGLYLMNPGSISLPPIGLAASYLELTIDGDQVHGTIKYLTD